LFLFSTRGSDFTNQLNKVQQILKITEDKTSIDCTNLKSFKEPLEPPNPIGEGIMAGNKPLTRKLPHRRLTFVLFEKSFTSFKKRSTRKHKSPPRLMEAWLI
jgi:hypothetical protein